MPERNFRMGARLWFGIIIAVLGVLFTLDNLGYTDAGAILRWWPVLLLAYGLTRLTGVFAPRHTLSGLILTLVGGWLLLDRFGVIHGRLWDFWPLILVIVGISLVAGGLTRRASTDPATGAATLSDSKFNAIAVWSGTNQRIVSPDFQGGEVTAIMGGHDIDLRGARMAGGEAVIDLFIWLGGAQLRVPEDWKVTCSPMLIMGGIDVRAKPPVGEAKGHLILKGVLIMGGVEVKN